MKWFFRSIGFIFILFLGLVAVGYFTSPTLKVDRSLSIDAYPEDIYVYLEDLEAFTRWAPWFARDPDANIIYGGADFGLGASVVWRVPGQTAEDAAQISREEIIAAQPPEFIQTSLLLGGEPASATYALSAAEEGTLVYIQFERELGGFPYLQRLTKRSREAALGAEFDSALERLKTIVETTD